MLILCLLRLVPRETLGLSVSKRNPSEGLEECDTPFLGPWFSGKTWMYDEWNVKAIARALENISRYGRQWGPKPHERDSVVSIVKVG